MSTLSHSLHCKNSQPNHLSLLLPLLCPQYVDTLLHSFFNNRSSFILFLFKLSLLFFLSYPIITNHKTIFLFFFSLFIHVFSRGLFPLILSLFLLCFFFTAFNINSQSLLFYSFQDLWQLLLQYLLQKTRFFSGNTFFFAFLCFLIFSSEIPNFNSISHTLF